MKRESHTFQILLWALAGSWICLLNLFVLWVKGGQVPAFFPLMLLFGVPVCWKWKSSGVVVLTLALFGLMIYSYRQIPLEDHFWFVGMGISTVLSLLITALAFQEMEVLIEAQAVESRSRLDNLWKVDEKKKAVEEELVKKKEHIRDLQIKMRSYQKLVDMATEETLAVRNRLQEQGEELQQMRNRVDFAEKKAKGAESHPSFEAKYLQLKDQFEEKGRVLAETRKELFVTNEKLMRIQKEFEESKLYQLNEAEVILERHLVQYHKEREELDEAHRKEIEALQEMFSGLLEKEK